jgi:predicted DNA-binding transcriptional regulator YafY
VSSQNRIRCPVTSGLGVQCTPDFASIEEQDDGSIILTMDTSGRYDVKRWVMSIGSEAELLEPKDLRDEIRDEVKAMAKAYK